MAELVQASLEGMLTELEQMQRVDLLGADEVKEVIKRRQRFEYKLQKREKKKEDILAYIQYECALLELIELRREKIKYFHNRNEIDFAIAKRVNRFFKILEHRFGLGGDLEIWTSHLNFLSAMKWTEERSRVLRRLVETRPHDPEAWNFAALYELHGSDGESETEKTVEEELLQIACARQLFLEGLRHHKDHLGLYRNFFCLELQNMACLARLEVPDGDVAQTEVIEGQIAKIVMKNMLESIPDNPLVDKALLDLIPSIPTPKIQRDLIETYLELRGHSSEAWDSVARSHLASGPARLEKKTFLDRIEACCSAYGKGLDRMPSAELFNYYLTTLLEIRASPDCAKEREGCFVTVKVLELYEKGMQLDILTDEHKSFFTDVLA